MMCAVSKKVDECNRQDAFGKGVKEARRSVQVNRITSQSTMDPLKRTAPLDSNLGKERVILVRGNILNGLKNTRV